MNIALSKKLKKELLELQHELYKHELNLELSKLHVHFLEWRENKIDPFELKNKIHEHYRGPSKELYLKYELPSFADLNVASGIVEGFLKIETLSDELRKIIEPQVKTISNRRHQ